MLLQLIIQILFKFNFNLKRRLKLYRLLAKTTNEKRNGVKIKLALEHLMKIEKKNYSDKTLMYRMYKIWIKKLNQGQEFGKILKPYIPPTEAMIISATETAGSISDGFYLANQIAKNQAIFIRIFKNAIISPTITLVAALGILSFFCLKVLPGLAGSLDANQMSSFSLFMAKVINNYELYFSVFIVAFIGLILLIIWALPNARAGIRLYLEKIPPFSIYRIVTGCSFLYAFSALSKAGLQQTDSLKRMADFAKPYLRYRIEKILYQMNRGVSFGVSLINTRLNFPDRDIVDELSMHSEAGNIEDALDEIITEMQIDGVELISLQAEITKYIGMALIIIVVLFIVTGLFSFIADIQAGSGSGV